MGVPAAAGFDTDGDGLRNTFENQAGVTSSSDPDSDGDGVVDAAEDNDGDRLSNRAEQKFGSHPGIRDSDGDGTPDGKEDADRDGRSNAVEQDHRRVPARPQPEPGSGPGRRLPLQGRLPDDRQVVRRGHLQLRPGGQPHDRGAHG